MSSRPQVIKLHGVASAEAVLDREVPLVNVCCSESRVQGSCYCSGGKIRRIIARQSGGGRHGKNVQSHDVRGQRARLSICETRAGAVRRTRADWIISEGPAEGGVIHSGGCPNDRGRQEIGLPSQAHARREIILIRGERLRIHLPQAGKDKQTGAAIETMDGILCLALRFRRRLNIPGKPVVQSKCRRESPTVLEEWDDLRRPVLCFRGACHQAGNGRSKEEVGKGIARVRFRRQ